MKEFEPMKAVYSYYFPETRRVVEKVNAPEDIFLTDTPSDIANKSIESLEFKKGFYLPKNELGNVDLDSMHEPVIDAIIEEYKDLVPGLSDFDFRYPTSGSSEGIFHFMSYLKNSGISNIKTLSGEYEGYREFAKTLGVGVEEYPKFDDNKEVGFWMISNPSARDGNIIDRDEIEALAGVGNDIALDLAYVGNTQEHKFDVTNPNIKTVFLSFSKPYGLFRFRIGFTFSRELIPSLYANKWFKSIPGLLLALKTTQDIGPRKLPEKYKLIQKEIVDEINQEFDLNLTSSDALLLANLRSEDAEPLSPDAKKLIDNFKRGDNYRFCLTPYYERKERE